MVNLISSDSEFLASMIIFTDYIVHTADTGYWVIQVDRLNERDILIDRKSSKSKIKKLTATRMVFE